MRQAARQNYFVKNGKIDFACPRCGFAKAVDVERYLGHGNEIRAKIRCRCERLQGVLLHFERRNGYRKPTDIQGRYFFAPKARPVIDGTISITDLSYAGLGFDLLPSAKGVLSPGDVLRVQFKLFQNASALIKKEAVVKRINALHTSASFREPLKKEDDFLLKLFFYT